MRATAGSRSGKLSKFAWNSSPGGTPQPSVGFLHSLATPVWLGVRTTWLQVALIPSQKVVFVSLGGGQTVLGIFQYVLVVNWT